MKTITKILSLLLLTSLFGCNITKRVPEGKYLLNKNEIVVDAKEPKFEVPTWDLEDIIKQEENRHIFKYKGQPRLRYKLWLYNLPSPEKTAESHEKKVAKVKRKHERKVDRIKRRNEKRERKGKEPREIPDMPSDTTSFREVLRETAGEPPVILDTTKMSTTSKQMQIWMVKNGWFNANVTDSVVYDTTDRKANVYYIVEPNDPYTVRKVNYEVEDSRLMSFVKFMVEKDSVIHHGDKFTVDALNHQRRNITRWCKNQGLYSFGKDYIYYKVDSTVGNHQVDVTLKVKNPKVKHPTKDTLIEGRHERYYYKDVIFYIGYDGNRMNDLSQYDTLHYKGFIFAYTGDEPKIKPRSLIRGMLIQPGGLYEEDSVSVTYKRLNNLGVFKSITIKFDIAGKEPKGYVMDCHIQLSFKKTQGFRVQANGTNEGGNLGVSGNASYHHNNLFRGAERFELGLTGGLEIQQLLVSEDESQQETDETFFSRSTPFNTVEYGPEMGLKIPRWMFFPGAFKNADFLSTDFKVGLNQQIRPDFKRTVQNFSWTYTAVPVAHQNIKLSLWELSALKINKSRAFQNRLDSLNDPVLNTSYQDHIISSVKASFTYSEFNNPVFKHRRNKVYFNIFGEGSGQLPRLWADRLSPTVSDWTGWSLQPDYNADNDSYEIVGIRFAQYWKTSIDIRDYFKISEGVTQVFRVMGGLGVPGKNLSQALPFEKAFFGGGPNGLRAWRARSVGPGTYLDSTFVTRYDKIGDIKIEGNIETRISFDWVELAFFADAGNIWLLNESKREGAEFTGDFYKQLAVGGGIGIRVDLDFFIIRFDFAKQMRDPALGDGENWWFQKKDNINGLRWQVLGPDNYSPYKAPWNVNLGIGYPF